MNIETIQYTFENLLAQLDWVTGLVTSINFILLVFARRIVHLVYHESENTPSFKRKLMIFRALNLLILIAFGYFHFYMPSQEKGVGLKLLAILVIYYLGYLSSHLANYLIIRRYGKRREINGESRHIDTYNTRFLNIFSQVFICIIVLISTIKVLGYDTLLEAGGVIGFIGVFLALTNNVWAPDIFSGLIILNSNMVEEGDVIKLNDGQEVYAMVYKTKVFHTELLDLINNHRVMIRNSSMRNYRVANLSKFASAKGLREQLLFHIGYDVDPADVRKMLRQACDKAFESKDLTLQKHSEMEIAINNTGDHAVEWIVSYFTKNVDQLPGTRRQLLGLFLETSREAGISLATPMTHEVTTRPEIE